MPDPVIVELAVNGATPRSRNRHVPRDPAEIAEVALAGVELGASIVHSHNDEPMFTPDGVHAVEPYLASWRPVLERHPELLMYPTMAAGAPGIPVQLRWAHVEELARRRLGGMTLVDPGSVNLGLATDGSIAQGTGAGPCQPAVRHRLHVRPQRRTRRGAEHLGLRARLPAGHAHLAALRAAACRRHGQALLRRGCWSSGCRRPPPASRPTWSCWSRPACRGRWPCSAGTSLAAGWPSGPSAGAVTSGSGWRTGPGAGEPGNLDLLRALTDLIQRLGRQPATIQDARRILGIGQPPLPRPR